MLAVQCGQYMVSANVLPFSQYWTQQLLHMCNTEPAYRNCVCFLKVARGGSTDKVEKKYMKLEIKVLKVQNTEKKKKKVRK